MRSARFAVSLFKPMIVFGVFILTILHSTPLQAEEETDPLCRLLFDNYVVRRGKVSNVDVRAAVQLISSRGRSNGFWKIVFAELKRNEERTEAGCVQVLGKMLSADAAVRERLEKDRDGIEQWQQIAALYLDEEVVEELVKRAEKADRRRADHYAIALTRARDARATHFFEQVLNDWGEREYRPSAKFHAAIGLAQMGLPEGMEWLIENCENQLDTVSNALPEGVTNRNLDVCCRVALHRLSGETELATKAEWHAWWKKAGNGFRPKHRVDFVDL